MTLNSTPISLPRDSARIGRRDSHNVRLTNVVDSAKLASGRKKTALINAPLSGLIAQIGHTDAICLSDAGLPVPAGTRRIDLAVAPRLLSFLDVLRVVLEELVVERAVCAAEILERNPETIAGIRALLQAAPVAFVPHEEFKSLSANSRGVVRIRYQISPGRIA